MLVCLNHIKAEESMGTSIGISAALDPDAYLGLMKMVGATDEQLQNAEVEIIKRKAENNHSGNSMMRNF